MKSIFWSGVFKFGGDLNQPTQNNTININTSQNKPMKIFQIGKSTPQSDKQIQDAVSWLMKMNQKNPVQSKIQLSAIPPTLIGANNKENTPSVLKKSPLIKKQTAQQAWSNLRQTLRQNSKLYDNALKYLGVPRQRRLQKNKAQQAKPKLAVQ